MFVISRNTAFTYQGKRVETKQIGGELCVRYVLEGSVRRSGNQVRVNAQLIDAETDAHLWAERFVGDTSDPFALQDEVTSRIAVALNLELIRAEAARSSMHPDALDYLLRGRAAYWRPPARDNFVQMIKLFDQALSLDELSIEAQSWLASALVARVLERLTDTPAEDIKRAEGLIERVLTVSPYCALAHWAKGQVLRAQNRSQEAIPEFETVIASDRNWVLAFATLGWCKFLTGSIEETIPLQEQAIRLSPRDPYIGNWYRRIGLVHLLQSRVDEAIFWFKKVLSVNPGHPLSHGLLASAYGLKGKTEDAAEELATARRLNANNLSSIARLKGVFDLGVPKVRALFEDTVFAGLRKAGVPEE